MLCPRRRVLKWGGFTVFALFFFYLLLPEQQVALSSWIGNGKVDRQVQHSLLFDWSWRNQEQKQSNRATLPNATGTKEKGKHNLELTWISEGNEDNANGNCRSSLRLVKQNYSQQEEDEERLTQRRYQVEDYCASVKPNPRYLDSKVPIVNMDSNFLHCPVTKSASTFWTRFVATLTTDGEMTSPFKMPLTKIPKTLFAEIGNKEVKVQFLRESVKNLFVREPYSRMFSAYIDKAFAPNPYYWKEWGSKRHRVRLPSLRSRKRCYHDVTFAEVMSFAATYFHKGELHFVPVSRRCHPCDFKYDVIGKMETFSDDLRYISHRMNLSLTDYFASDNFRYDYAKDAIEDSINSPFGWLTQIFQCIDKYEMGLRIWRKLQIRGLIDRRIQFPYSKEDFLHVTAKELIEIALKAYRESTDRAELKRQKREAFIEAYRTVDMKVLRQIEKIFMNDFQLFGYENSPADVFDRTKNLTSTGALDWSKPWTG